MDELQKPELKRPMSREAMGNDAGMMRNLMGLLNNPAITGAEVPPEEKKKIESPGPVQPTLPASPQKQTRPPVAAVAAAGAVSKRFLFTGNSRTGKTWLAQQAGMVVLELDDPIIAMARTVFGNVDRALLNRFLQEVRAWGDGEISPNYPLTASRAAFVENIRESGKEGDSFFQVPAAKFGSPGFWMGSLISRANHKASPSNSLVVTDVSTPDQYTTLVKSGFVPYHVTCNNLTRSSRGGSALTNSLADSIDRDVTKKVSESPNGKKLRCVWNDEKYPSPSPRLLTVHEFLSAIHG